jgi:hypothetical protein
MGGSIRVPIDNNHVNNVYADTVEQWATKNNVVRLNGLGKDLVRISVNPIGRFGFIRSLFHLLFRPCQFYLK